MSTESETIVDARTSSESCAVLLNRSIDELKPGKSFILVADHDPCGLHYMLDAERPGVASWEDLEGGPETWRARITRALPGA